VSKTVVNKLIKGQITIVKIDENRTPISGVTFQILDSNKKVVDTIITDQNGKATSKKLAVGTYYYKEISGPANIIIDNTTYVFKLTETNQVVTKTVVNKLVKGHIEILKVDENNTPLEGVKFQILDSKKNVVDTITTGKDGKATSKDLTLGTYYYKEIEAPSNVIMDTEEHAFSLTSSAKIVTKKVVNKLSEGSLKIIKVDENNKPLEGVKFNILDENKKIVDTITTNANGIAESKELKMGTYYYQEISAPEGIVIDNTMYKFVISENGQNIIKNMVNKYAKGKLEIVKVDESNTPISGVKFNILDSKKNVVDTIITGTDGKATSKDLTLGTYYYKEIEAPTNVVMDTAEYEFKLTANNQIITKRVVNRKVAGNLVIIKVDENNKPLEGVKFEILDVNKKLVETIVTNSEGKATSSKLAIGTYYYKEVEAPSNVILDSTEYKFKITEANTVITKKVVNKLSEGKLKIIKVDENNKPLEGVTFNILDENKNVIDTIITNKDGIAESKELKMGTYYYQEISAPSGIIVDNTMYKFVISENGQNVIKNMVNKYAKGKLIIVKVDENNTPIEGVKFNILDSNKNIVDTIITDKDGKATSKELVLGIYYYQEVEAPSNVVMDTAEYEFKLTENNQIITKKVVNKLSEGKLKIIKVDENNKPLEGVTFNILDENKNVIDTIITNKDGIAESKELKMGTYYYQEISAPSGIIVDNTMYKFVISENGQNVIKNMVNKYAKGKLAIVKVDENNTPIEGVKFNILDSNKNTVDTIITDKDGKATSKELTYGKYYYQEVEVPNQYVIDNKEYMFSITENDQVITKKVVNKLSEGKLKIIKVDENNKPLEGVTFNILDENKNVIDTITTNKDGIAESKELTVGTYYYQEVSAPEGIIIDNTVYKFVISENGQNVIKNMVNKYAKGKLEIIKLDERDLPIEGVKFEIKDANGNIVDTIITDKDGKATSKELILGTYYYQEVEAPEKYVIDSNEYEFDLTKNEEVISKIVVNIEKYGNLQIIKLDKETKKTIANVTFNIIDSEGTIVDIITTDANGIAVSKNLVLGTYSYYEVSAPNGYIIDNNVYEFKLTEHHEIKSLKVYNMKEKLPVTGGVISTDMMIIIIVAFISIFGYSIMSILEYRKEI
ncbi:MAG: SpaA isopeptide-forming pilin-related protein, partial [Clostridia bacterium]|nr:SpaA isopeptide-forming pilin-related protein [Clostridia bacterium]